MNHLNKRPPSIPRTFAAGMDSTLPFLTEKARLKIWPWTRRRASDFNSPQWIGYVLACNSERDSGQGLHSEITYILARFLLIKCVKATWPTTRLRHSKRRRCGRWWSIICMATRIAGSATILDSARFTGDQNARGREALAHRVSRVEMNVAKMKPPSWSERSPEP